MKMSSSSKLTVITATYNKGPRLLRTVESILGQTMPDFDFIVINDESTDHTKDLLDRVADDRLRVIHQKNMGLTATLEATLRKITTPYVAIQGAGDYSHLERFEKQISYLEAHEDVAVLGCDREDRDVEGNLIKVSSPPFRRLASQAEAIKRNILNHGEVMFRRSAYVSAGGYRPFFKYAQDRDLWVRIIKYGDIVSMPELLYTRMMDPRFDVSGNPERTCAQAKFSQYGTFLARGDLEGRWDNETIDPAERYEEFEASLGPAEKRAIARRIYSQVRAIRMPPEEEKQRIEVTSRIMRELVPGSWMQGEISLRKTLLGISPILFAGYSKLCVWLARLKMSNKRGNRRQPES
jgi:hypothetical protein